MKLSLSNRQLFLIVSLEEKNYSTAQELADVLNVSVRTIKSEISHLRKILDKDSIVIHSKPSYGYKIEVKDREHYKKMTNNLQGNNIKAIQDYSKDSFNRMTYIIRELLVAENYKVIDELAEELFVSRSTIEKDFIEVRKLLEKYKIRIDTKPKYGIKLEGTEFDLRRAISEYYFNQPLSISFNASENKNNIISKIESILIKSSNTNNIMLSEFSIKNIAIHIYISFIRFNKGFHLQDSIHSMINGLSEASKITASEIITEINNELDVGLFDSEQEYLALHLDSKQILEKPTTTIEKDQEIIRDIIEEIHNNFNLDFSKDKMLLKFLYQHVPQMINRIRRGLVIRNPLLQENMRKYLFALKITESAVYILEKRYSVEIPLDEFGYLMLYFQNALNNIKENRKINIGFIMGRGRSDTIVYQQEIREHLPTEEYEIIPFSNWQEIQESEVRIDIIVSVYSNTSTDFKYTVNIENGHYIEEIRNYAYEIKINEIKIDQYFKPEYFVSYLSGKNPKEVFENIVGVLQNENIITEDVHLKEPFVSQEIGNEIVHLQDLYKICRRPVGFVGILKEPIIWDKSVVRIIFLIKTKRDGDKDLPIICRLFSDFITDSSKVMTLKEDREFEKFRENLTNK